MMKLLFIVWVLMFGGFSPVRFHLIKVFYYNRFTIANLGFHLAMNAEKLESHFHVKYSTGKKYKILEK